MSRITARARQVVTTLFGGTNGNAITAGLGLVKFIAPFHGHIVGLAAWKGGNNGSATVGNDVLDVRINGVSIFASAGDQPTLAFNSGAGEWTFGHPKQTQVRPGDQVVGLCQSIATGGGAVDVYMAIALGE